MWLDIEHIIHKQCMCIYVANICWFSASVSIALQLTGNYRADQGWSLASLSFVPQYIDIIDLNKHIWYLSTSCKYVKLSKNSSIGHTNTTLAHYLTRLPWSTHLRSWWHRHWWHSQRLCRSLGGHLGWSSRTTTGWLLCQTFRFRNRLQNGRL